MSQSAYCYYGSTYKYCDYCCMYDTSSYSYYCGSYFECNPSAYAYTVAVPIIIFIAIIVGIVFCIRRRRRLAMFSQMNTYAPPPVAYAVAPVVYTNAPSYQPPMQPPYPGYR